MTPPGSSPHRLSLPRDRDEALTYFSRIASALRFVASRRWPDGVTCPQCGSTSVYVDRSRQGWECKNDHPKRKFTVKTGTIFEDSALTLDKWLVVIWMVANTPHGVNSHEAAQVICVTQKTAWWMLKKIDVASRAQGEMHQVPDDEKQSPDK